MDDEDKSIVHEAIKSHGDDFWREGKNGGGWNGFLFDEIVKLLNQDGYDLKVVRLDE